MASVLRLFFSASEEKSADSSFGLSSAELLARRLGDPAGGLDLQLEALGDAFQAVGLLVDHVAEGPGGRQPLLSLLRATSSAISFFTSS